MKSGMAHLQTHERCIEMTAGVLIVVIMLLLVWCDAFALSRR
jgi:hypothetical protein